MKNVFVALSVVTTVVVKSVDCSVIVVGLLCFSLFSYEILYILIAIEYIYECIYIFSLYIYHLYIYKSMNLPCFARDVFVFKLFYVYISYID